MNELQAIRTARSLVSQAHEKVTTACVVLRRNGLGEIADDLSRLAKQAKVWNEKDGYLDHIERQCK